jgi:hypothetical protein
VVIPTNECLNFDTGSDNGTATGAKQYAFPTPRDTEFILRGWGLNFHGELDNEIREIGFDRKGDEVTVYYADKDADDTFNWSLAWAYIGEIPAVVDQDYTSDLNAELLNPERGIYYWYDNDHSYNTIVAEWLYLGTVCDQPLIWNGHHQDGTSPILDEYADKLLNYRPPCEDGADNTFCGKKVLFRPRYDVRGNVTPSSNVCGKFQADSLSLQLDHIDAVAKMLGDFKDVVAFIEAGYLGQWGEWNTFNFPGTSPILDDVCDRDKVVDRILLKYGEVGLQQHVGLRRPVFAKQVIDRNADARVGIYNDCFMSNELDYGTYSNYDDDCNVPDLDHCDHPDPVNCNPSNFPAADDAKAWARTFTANATFGGETCPVDENDDDVSDGTERWWSCDNMIGANSEPGSLHMSYLHGGYANEAVPAWNGDNPEGEKCYDEIRRKLGYRFEVTRVEYTPKVIWGHKFSVSIVIKNTGWSKLHKPREAKLVLRDGVEPSLVFTDTSGAGAVETWAPGDTITLSFSGRSPRAGKFSVRLWIPDPYDPNSDDPDAPGLIPYSVKLATLRNGASLFDPETGDNDLGIFITRC